MPMFKSKEEFLDSLDPIGKMLLSMMTPCYIDEKVLEEFPEGFVPPEEWEPEECVKVITCPHPDKCPGFQAWKNSEFYDKEKDPFLK